MNGRPRRTVDSEFDSRRYRTAFVLLSADPTASVAGWNGATHAIRRFSNAVTLVDSEGRPHCAGGPAEVTYDGSTVRDADWFEHGQLRRTAVFDPDGVLLEEQWFDRGQLHRADGPAVTSFRPDGGLESQEWYLAGSLHRLDGPALVSYAPSGDVESEHWYRDGQRIDAPLRPTRARRARPRPPIAARAENRPSSLRHTVATPATATAPVLEGDAARAVAHRGGHLQIIAAAGSGKTETVAQRVASLLAEGVDPRAIVAFTFTEKAAAELKERIRLRAAAIAGEEISDRLGPLFVGTIHAYCFHLLQDNVPEYETYSVLDENQHVILLTREAQRLGLRDLPEVQGLFSGIRTFIRSVDVVENELLTVEDLPAGPFRDVLEKYYATLDRYRLMTFGQQVARAVRALEDPEIHQRVTQGLHHLIVDEYQDINPAQERLIELLARPHGKADLAVVGDDDQAIYQWRGSDVQNIVTFHQRYTGVTQFRLLTNRRSRPAIIDLANAFAAANIPERLPKQMGLHRTAEGPAVEVHLAPTVESGEATHIAARITDLHRRGVPYRDVAVLVRGRTAYPALTTALGRAGIPVQTGGRTGLFDQAVARALGKAYCWLGDVEWKSAGTRDQRVSDLEGLVTELGQAFRLDPDRTAQVAAHLKEMKAEVPDAGSHADLVGGFYGLIAVAGVKDWNLEDPIVVNDLGTLARFSNLLADFEGVRRRARIDQAVPGEQVGGSMDGRWYFWNLAILLSNYAQGTYDGFDGDDDGGTDAVTLSTIHGAKGLEWPYVFVASLTAQRFPSARTGRSQTFLLPEVHDGRQLFDRERLQGSIADEARLFYVAMTRARDWLSLSTFSHYKNRRAQESRFFAFCRENAAESLPPMPHLRSPSHEAPELRLTYSELASYLSCAHSYYLRTRLGFMPSLAPELGYGHAVHHVMRLVAEYTRRHGAPPSPSDLDALMDAEFFLPYANKPAHREMKQRGKSLVASYIRDHADDLRRTWATERPFELHLPGVVISGRADVIYDGSGDRPEQLTLVDYKTSAGDEVDPLQLQIYANAGRREGLSVTAAFVHDLQSTQRQEISLASSDLHAVEHTIIGAASNLRSRAFDPDPVSAKCRRCDVRALCRAAVR